MVPVPPHGWKHTHSTQLIHRIMEGRMYPLTLGGLDQAHDLGQQRVLAGGRHAHAQRPLEADHLAGRDRVVEARLPGADPTVRRRT